MHLETPKVGASPVAYPSCCLALSAPLVGHVQSLLPRPPALTLSIGSGFGLLEACLMTGPMARHVVGIEVEPSSNQYLPASHHRVVHGTRFLDPLAAEAAAWLFVYPRRLGLVEEYLAQYGNTSVETVIWAGPKADWDDYKACFSDWHVQEQSADEVGGKPWELIAVAKKRP
ncbi:mitochondrial presequence protease [Pyrenophora seminiperda CCB06]|uniref:Mitochondrial presequence protease n=1 Tax=Pyrenophora seminiperda CCB06 TaxID=1302712 RepID=A0A3M7LYN2_9PLEO|nr:mitochondrial presequence protease [Pyrenophora seminiperda CCB06]